jgi:hypothetical protein
VVAAKSDVRSGDRLTTELAKGQKIYSRVEEAENGKKE